MPSETANHKKKKRKQFGMVMVISTAICSLFTNFRDTKRHKEATRLPLAANQPRSQQANKPTRPPMHHSTPLHPNTISFQSTPSPISATLTLSPWFNIVSHFSRFSVFDFLFLLDHTLLYIYIFLLFKSQYRYGYICFFTGCLSTTTGASNRSWGITILLGFPSRQ